MQGALIHIIGIIYVILYKFIDNENDGHANQGHTQSFNLMGGEGNDNNLMNITTILHSV